MADVLLDVVVRGDLTDLPEPAGGVAGFLEVAQLPRRSGQAGGDHHGEQRVAGLELVLIGHSTGGGEVVRYAAQQGGHRVTKIVTAGVLADASQFHVDLSESFFGANRAGSEVSEGARREFWR